MCNVKTAAAIRSVPQTVPLLSLERVTKGLRQKITLQFFGDMCECDSQRCSVSPEGLYSCMFSAGNIRLARGVSMLDVVQ